MKQKSTKYDIFISYRREGGEFTAKILRDRLEKLGYRVFFDVETLRSGDFNTQLFSVIDQCQDVLLVLSPNALDRCSQEGDWVRYEAERALAKEKNIIPIMLHGFDFPKTLPESMEPLRYKQGLTANSQFFDAFMETLVTYLKAKPHPPASRLLTVIIAAAVAALAAGLVWFFCLRDTGFPHTAAEKSVTDEVIYYAESNLTYIDMMSDAAGAALDSAHRYLTTGSSGLTSLDAAIDAALETIGSCELDRCAPSDDFLRRVGELREVPFSTADLIGMHDVAVSTQTQWLGNLSFVLWAADPDSYLAADMRLAIVENLQGFLEEDDKRNAYCVNELLLPVTKDGALDDFFQQYLPTLKRIPLSAGEWSQDPAALSAAEEASQNRQNDLVMERSAMTGNMTMENAALRESLIRSYETAGLSRTEAEELVEQWMELMGLQTEADSLIEKLRPQPEDGWDVLWIKLQSLVTDGEYDYALECVDYLDVLMAGDADAALYLPALRRFIASIGATGVDYGVMVMAWYDPQQPNEQYEIGDVIIAVNGQPCRDLSQFTAMRDGLTEEDYTVTVLRADSAGALAPVDLAMRTDMPLAYLMDLTFSMQ